MTQPQQQQQPVQELQSDKNTRYWGYLILAGVLLLGCFALYALSGAFVTGVLGVGTVVGLFSRAAGA
jgi:hypothetical protein